MKKLILGVASLAIVLASCSDDDDSGSVIIQPQAAVLSGGPYSFCVGDGLVDNITDDVVENAGVGSLNSFVVTNVEGWILGLPPVASGPDFDGAGVGDCYVYHINYLAGLEGLTGPDADTGEPTANINDLEGVFALSNFLTVNREDCAPSVVAARLEAGDSAVDGEYTFSVGDGVPDNITDLTVADAGAGQRGQIVVTDDQGWILGLPPVFQGPDFDVAGVGVCYVRHLNYDGDITGLTGPVDGTPTANINDLEGDFKFSNIIVVNRIDSAASVVAATLEVGDSAVEGEYTFSVGDGIADNVTDLIVSDAGTGENTQIVVTDDQGWILGLPPVFQGPNFDGAGVGVCYIRQLNYDGDIIGLTGLDSDDNPTANINDLEGDFKLSNIIVVNRVDSAPSVVAATLEAGASAVNGEYTFTVGDGNADNVTDLIVEDAGAGEIGRIVVTDDQGWILGLPPAFDVVDFDVTGVGVCYFRHINYDGDITGLTGPDSDGSPTANVNDLEGDFKLSNIIVVNRVN